MKKDWRVFINEYCYHALPDCFKTQILPLISDSDREQQALFVAFIAQEQQKGKLHIFFNQ
jgi:hypothetical protein